METIGKYQVLEKIGSGGFAVVYKGYDPFIKRSVAIKVCYANDEETRQRFYREAEIAGRLVHRNITTVYDFGLRGETPYLVEEYLSGEDLAHMIHRGEPGTLEEKLDILIQTAGGLAYAHAQGVIHRDVKPANVRVLDSGLVKIMDFGTAKLTGTESNLTRTGMTLGTVAYLAPERLRGLPAMPAADLFSFGVTAYELLSFERPFVGDNIPLLIAAVLESEPPSLAHRARDCPPALAAIIERCLAKDAAARHPSCAVLIEELERVRDDHTGLVRVPVPAAGGDPVSSAALELLPVLVERARQLVERGSVRRAAVLLEEVLEIDPDNAEAARLVAACAPPASLAPPSPSAPPPISADQRQRQVAEAMASIEHTFELGRLRETAAALAFAIRLYGDFPERSSLCRRIVDELRSRVEEVRRTAETHARRYAGHLRSSGQRLPASAAEILTRHAEELAGRTAARSAVQELRRLATAATAGERQRKQADAAASIERLIAAGKADMAERALVFAVRLFGEFEQVGALRERIAAVRERS